MTDKRIFLKSKWCDHGVLVFAGKNSWSGGPMGYRLWRARRYLALCDKYGIDP